MKISQNELIILGVIIVYIAFFTHPPPSHITNLLETPIGHMVALLGILYVTIYKSLILGVFLGLAYIMTARNVTEYLDEKEQKPKVLSKDAPSPTAAGIPPPAVTGALKSMLKKGDTRLPQAQGKNVTAKPETSAPPKGATPSNLKPKMSEGFSNF